MAQQTLGGLTTLNLATNLDPMFTELYAAAGGNFTSVTTFTLGNGVGSKVFNINSASGGGFGTSIRFQRGGATNFLIGDAGGIIGGASDAGDGLLYLTGANNMRFYTNAAERMRIDSTGNVGIGSSGATVGAGSQGRVFSVSASASVPSFIAQGAGPQQGVIGFGTQTQKFQIQGGVDYGGLNFMTYDVVQVSIDSSSIKPGADNTKTLGAASFRWSVVYAGTGTINTSDAREKTAVEELDALEIAASIALGKEIGGFKFLSAIKEKGSSEARFHIGMTVQRAMEVMTDHGLDPLAYAFICHDEWAESTTPEETDEDGKVTREAVTTPAGDRYGFRVDELSLFIMRGLVARLDAMEA